MSTEKKQEEVMEAAGKEKKEDQKDKEKIQKVSVNKEEKKPKKEIGEVQGTGKQKASKKDKEIEGRETAETEEGKETAGEGKKEQEEIEKIGFTDLDHYAQVRKDLPAMKTGDVVSVSYRVIEGGKERIQVFEGLVIALKNTGISKTVTVRKTSFGVAVERIFPVNSSLIQKIQVKKHSQVRRAKLYYLRKLKGKAARLKEMR